MSLIEKVFSNTKLYPIYAFSLTAIVYTSVLSGVGVLGNGLYLLETGDWMTQHIPFIMQMGEVIKGNHSLWYSWNMGIGCGSIGSYSYYTFSPFNTLYWILGEQYKHIASSLIIILKAGFSAATFQIFSQKLLRRTYFETILFSMLYALNGFAVCDFHSILSLDAVMIFPMIATGIIILVCKNRITILVLTYSYLFFTSLYMGYIAGVCSFIIFVFYYIYKRIYIEKRIRYQIVVKYFLSVLIAMGLTAFIWIPAVINIFDMKSSDELYKNVINCTPIMLLNNMFAGMYQSIDGFIPYYFCGLISVMAVPLFVFNRHIKQRKRKYYLLCLMSIVLIILIPPLNYAMHGFDRPNGVGYRYAFVISFIILSILSEQFVYMSGRMGLNIKYFISLIIFCIITFILNKYIIIEKMSESADSNKWYVLIGNVTLLLAFYGSIKAYSINRLDKSTKRVLFASVVTLEMIFNIGVVQKRMPARGSVIIEEYYSSAEENTARRIKEESINDVNIRTIYQDSHIVNIALEKDLSSIVYFSSLMNQRFVKAMKSLGFEYGSNTMTGNGWTPITASLLGIDYIVDGENVISDDPNIPVMLGAESNEHLYQNYIKNDKVLPLAFLVNKKILNYKTSESVLDNQINLLEAMVGRQVKCYKHIDMIPNMDDSDDVSVEMGNNEVVIKNENYPVGSALIKYVTTNRVKNDIFVNLYNNKKVYKDSIYWKSPSISANYDVDVYHTVTQRIYPNKIFKSGNIENEESSFVINIPPEIETVTYKKGYFVEYNEVDYDRVYEEIKSGGLLINEFKDGFVKGKIRCTNDCVLFSSIPYEKGWTACVDGVKTNIVPLVEDAFVGIELSSGDHEIILKYIAPGMYVGRWVTIGTVILICSSILLSKIKQSAIKMSA